jgi:hypothetical protein
VVRAAHERRRACFEEGEEENVCPGKEERRRGPESESKRKRAVERGLDEQNEI